MDEVLVIHQHVIDAFLGGAEGVRDLGLLESAMLRPRCGYYEDLPTMASALFESLLINRPFVDGNKRVAVFATDVFLRLYGWRLEVDPHEAYRSLMQLLENREADLDRLTAWITRSLVKDD